MDLPFHRYVTYVMPHGREYTVHLKFDELVDRYSITKREIPVIFFCALELIRVSKYQLTELYNPVMVHCGLTASRLQQKQQHSLPKVMFPIYYILTFIFFLLKSSAMTNMLFWRITQYKYLLICSWTFTVIWIASGKCINNV